MSGKRAEKKRATSKRKERKARLGSLKGRKTRKTTVQIAASQSQEAIEHPNVLSDNHGGGKKRMRAAMPGSENAR